MEAVMSEMRIVKGGGTGSRAVFGKLRAIKREIKNCDDGLDDRARFLRARGIAISRLEESLELFGVKPEFAEISAAALEMIALLRGRALSAELFEICEAGIGIEAGIAHIEAENDENIAARECCLLLRRILNGSFGLEMSESAGVIAVSYERMDITEISAPAVTEISGIVSVGDRESLFARAIDIMGVTGLFISEEDAELCIPDATAILSPKREALYVSPKIEIVDQFRSDISAESCNWELCRALRFFCGERGYSVVERNSEREVGVAVECEEFLEEGFEFYRSVAELSESQNVTFLIRGTWNYREALSGIFRAAVYGRLSVAVSVESASEFLDFCATAREVREELTLERREFDEGIAIGVIVDNIFNTFLTDKLSRDSDFIMIDEKKLFDGASEKDRVALGKSLFELISQKCRGKPIYALK